MSHYRFLVQTERGGLRWSAGRWHFLPKPDRQLGSNPEATALENVPVPRSEQGVVAPQESPVVDEHLKRVAGSTHGPRAPWGGPRV